MEIIDCDTIRQNLRSDKATFRKQGRMMFDQMLAQINISNISASDVLGFIQAVMEYERKEQSAASAKSKVIGHDVAEFFRRVARFSLKSGLLHAKHVRPFLNHIIDVLSDQSLSDYYKSFHKSLLLDILTPRLTFTMDVSSSDAKSGSQTDQIDMNANAVGLRGLIVYLTSMLQERKYRKDVLTLKILRATCSCLFMDVTDIQAILAPFVHIIVGHAQEESSVDSRDYTLTLYAAESLTFLLQYHGLNLLSGIIDECRSMSLIFQKHAASGNLKEGPMDIIIKFIAAVTNIGDVRNDGQAFKTNQLSSKKETEVLYHRHCTVLSIAGDIQREILKGWPELFLSEFFLGFLHATLQKRLTRSTNGILSFTLVDSDLKSSYLLKIISKVLLLYGCGPLPFRSFSDPSRSLADNRKSSQTFSTPDAPPSKRARRESSNLPRLWPIYKTSHEQLLLPSSIVGNASEAKRFSNLSSTYAILACLLIYSLSDDQKINQADENNVRDSFLFVRNIRLLLENSIGIANLQVNHWLCYVIRGAIHSINHLARNSLKQSMSSYLSCALEENLCALFTGLFSLINMLLQKNSKTSENNELLRTLFNNILSILNGIRTYPVVSVNLYQKLLSLPTLLSALSPTERCRLYSLGDELGLLTHVPAILADVDDSVISALFSSELNSILGKHELTNASFTSALLAILMGNNDLNLNSITYYDTSLDALLNHLSSIEGQSHSISILQRDKSCLLSCALIDAQNFVSFAKVWIEVTQHILNTHANRIEEGYNSNCKLHLSLLCYVVRLFSCKDFQAIHHEKYNEVTMVCSKLQVQLYSIILDHFISCEKREVDYLADVDLGQFREASKVLKVSEKVLKAPLLAKLDVLVALLWEKIVHSKVPLSQDGANAMDIESDERLNDGIESNPFDLTSSLPLGTSSKINARNSKFDPRATKQTDVSIYPEQLVLTVVAAFDVLEEHSACCSFLDRCLPITLKAKINCDILLGICDAAALEGDLLLFQYIIEGCTTWKKEWGPLAYGRILRGILRILNVRGPFHLSAPQYNFIEYISHIVFANDDGGLSAYIERFWLVRVYQLEIIASLMKLQANLNDMKKLIADLFVERMGDIDIRVRQRAAVHCSLLVSYFKNAHKVYDSLHQVSAGCLGQIIVLENPVSAALQLSVLVDAFVGFGVGKGTDEGIRMRTVLDVNAWSAVLVNNLDNITEIKGVQRIQKDAVYQIILSDSKSSGKIYTLSEWLLGQWLSGLPVGMQSAFSIPQLRLDLGLHNFPFDITYCAPGLTVKDHISLNLDWLIPAICSVLDSKLRWETLTLLCTQMGVVSNDASIAKIMKGQLVQIKALEYFYSSLFYLHQEEALQQYYNKKSRHIVEFVDRVVRSSDFTSIIKENATIIIRQLMLWLCSYDESVELLAADRPKLSFDWDNIDSISENYTLVFKNLCKAMGLKEIDNLLRRCNIHYLLCSIRKFIIDFRKISCIVFAISFTNLLIREGQAMLTANKRLTAIVLALFDEILQSLIFLQCDAQSSLISYFVRSLLPLFACARDVKSCFHTLCLLSRLRSLIEPFSMKDMKDFSRLYYGTSEISSIGIDKESIRNARSLLDKCPASLQPELWQFLVAFSFEGDEGAEKILLESSESFNCLLALITEMSEVNHGDFLFAFGGLWILVLILKRLLSLESMKKNHEAWMNTRRQYRNEIASMLVNLHAKLNKMSAEDDLRSSSIKDCLIKEVVQVVSLVDAEYTWLSSNTLDYLLPCGGYLIWEKLPCYIFRQLVYSVERNDDEVSGLACAFFSELSRSTILSHGNENLDYYRSILVDDLTTGLDQTFLSYLHFPVKMNFDKLFLACFCKLFDVDKACVVTADKSAKPQSFPIAAESDHIFNVMQFMVEHVWDERVWLEGDAFSSSEYVSYELFIRKLSTHILLYVNNKHSGSSLEGLPDMGDRITCQYFSFSALICISSAELGELILIQCLCYLLKFLSKPSGNQAAGKDVLQHLYDALCYHLCQSKHLQARRLAYRAVIALIQMLTDNCKTMQKVILAEYHGNAGPAYLPSLEGLKILVETALGCQDSSAAWFLIEFVNEIEVLALSTTRDSTYREAKLGKTSESLVQCAIERNQLNDSDLLHALDVSTSLRLQGQLFTCRGDFLSALSAYESLLSVQQRKLSDQSLQGEYVNVLHELGLEQAAQALSLDTPTSQLSRWNALDEVGKDIQLSATSECKWKLLASTVEKNVDLCISCDSLKKLARLLTLVSNKQQEIVWQTDSSPNSKTRRQNNIISSDFSSMLSLSPKAQIQAISGAITPFLQGGETPAKTVNIDNYRNVKKCLRAVDGLLEDVKGQQAHALSPTLYNFWNRVRSGFFSSKTCEVHKIHIDIQESRLLWSRGLKDAAIKHIKQKSCASLTHFLEVNKAIDMKINYSARFLLSECLCLAGIWMSGKGLHSVEDVIDHSLSPALTLIQQCSKHINREGKEGRHQNLVEDAVEIDLQELRCNLAIARYHEQRYHRLRIKVTSREWLQRQKFLDERITELDSCHALRDDIVKETRAIDTKLAAGQVHLQDARNEKEKEWKLLNRHIATLKKEVDMDTRERNSTYSMLNLSLTQCIQHYMATLKLSTSLFGGIESKSKEQSHGAMDSVPQYSEVVDVVFRIVSLWLSSTQSFSQHNLAQSISETLLAELKYHNLPLQSFVLLHQQIFSRLGSNLCTDQKANQSVQEVISYIAIAMGKLYPYHVLPSLFSLLHNNIDHAAKSSDSNPAESLHELEIGSSILPASEMDARQIATRQVLQTINKQFLDDNDNKESKFLVSAMQKLLVQYILLAKTSTAELHQKGRTKQIKYTAVQDRGKRFNEEILVQPLKCKVPILTRSIPIHAQNGGKYDRGVIMLEACEDKFDVTENGISRPKIISVIGSDGQHYRQVVKGGDDLRQDAVMQQVFDNVNITLQRQRRGRSRLVSQAMKGSDSDYFAGDAVSNDENRQVYIRTYKVIPTTAQTGIMEFVENTAPFGALVCDAPGAAKTGVKVGLHSRHRPNDWTHVKCREHLKNAADSAEKLEALKTIYSNFQPVFRYFFLEKFSSPSLWHSRRCQYINSVAVNSMIGYILGIGDRHAHNLLVDVNSGEVVHIDFGIVFEQGQLLTVPETVPFRLTRDIVDGMGILGVEGQFRRCCEHVLRTLQKHRDNLMVILEVVLFDPLYKWSLSPLQMRNKQQKQQALSTKVDEQEDSGAYMQGRVQENDVRGEAAGTVYDAATRALNRIQGKLQGYEEQLSTGDVALSVEDMVSLTINASMDINNLAQIFPGWSPWL